MQPKFLYIEDDSLSREIMTMMLGGLGYNDVIIFDNSHDFLGKLAALPFIPDVIFLDIHVPPLDGFEMLKILREHPDFAQQKIIALTASVMNEEIAKLRRSGFDGAMGKPLDFDEFPALLHRILQGETIWIVA